MNDSIMTLTFENLLHLCTSFFRFFFFFFFSFFSLPRKLEAQRQKEVYERQVKEAEKKREMATQPAASCRALSDRLEEESV